jgi:hypothetical protein
MARRYEIGSPVSLRLVSGGDLFSILLAGAPRPDILMDVF